MNLHYKQKNKNQNKIKQIIKYITRLKAQKTNPQKPSNIIKPVGPKISSKPLSIFLKKIEYPK